MKRLIDAYYRMYNTLNKREFRIAEADYTDLAQKDTDEFKRLYFEESDVLIVKNFLSPAEVTALLQRLKTSPPTVADPKPYGPTYGRTLIDTKNDLDGYFNDAAAFEPQLNQLMGFDFNNRFSTFFSKLAGNTPVVPPQLNGRHYTPGTLKIMQPGKGALPVHVGLEFYTLFTELSHLYSLIYGTAQISYFIVLQYPEQGGEITLYDVRYPKPENERFKSRRAKLHYVRTRPAQRLKPPVGSMFIFNGGQIWHKIEDFYGSGERITFSGFLNYSKDLKTIYYWS